MNGPIWGKDVESLSIELQGVASLLLQFGEQFEPGASMLSPEGNAAAVAAMSLHLSRIAADLTNAET